LGEGVYEEIGKVRSALMADKIPTLWPACQVNELTMRRILLFYTLALCFHHGAFAQSYSYDFNIANKLKNYFSTYDPEKAYLQFDRPYYAAGDTIFFKAYVTEGGYHQLSGLSGVLHVDLINTENKIDQSIKLRLDNGVCWGDFALPDSLRTGNYRIRAYTEWMLNLGELDFFDQPVPVGSLVNPVGSLVKRNVPDSRVKDPMLIRHKADVQFFPEGGTLVEGIKAKVAFKAIGTNGLAIGVKGVIIDKGNKQICSFESSHLGMGYFSLLPEKDDAYKAALTFSDGTQNTVDLPIPVSSGIALSVITDSISTISIIIKTNGAFYRVNRNKDFLLVIYSGGKTMTYPSKQDVPIVTLDLEKKVLRTGVSRITLFSPDGEPVCERLIFVQNDDLLKLQIHTDKIVYRKREKVNLLLSAKNPTTLPVDGHFSMTIIDESKMPMNENSERNIETHLLLTSDLKGYVEQPNYYFNDTSGDARENLDVLMLTQGYRNFEWKPVLSNNSAILAFQPEKGLEINGKVTDLSNRPISERTVTLVPSKGGPVLSSESDDSGLFHFSNLVFMDTAHLVLSTENSHGEKTTKITYLNANHGSPAVHYLSFALPIMEDTGMSVYLGIANRWHDKYDNYGPGKGKLLNPVTVKGVKLDDQYRTQSLAGAGFADQVMHADEIERIGGQLSTSLNGRLVGVNIINGIPFLQSTIQNSNISTTGASPIPMLVVLDGTEITPGPGFNIDFIPSTQVENVEVLRYASTSIYGMQGANGVLIITTKNARELSENIASVGVLPIAPAGFYMARTFYSPKYDHSGGDSTESELRPTIYWNPEIKMDKEGSAILEYFNARDTGIYKVIVEGVDRDGNIGRLVYRYKVE
jgi:TonB-dependent SusC/RagA subfamily outer membrane receptor